MKISAIIKHIGAAALLTWALASVSCTDEKEPDPHRLFRPVNIQLTTLENSVTATWANMAGALNYEVELFGEERVKGPDGNVTNYVLVASNYNLEGTKWSVSGLQYATTYWFRVKANSGNPEFDSRYSALESIKTQAETVVVSAEITDADTGTVLFTWLEGYDLTELTILGPDEYELTVSVNDAAGQYEVTGLKAGDYTVTARNDLRAFNTYAFRVPILKELSDADNAMAGVTFRWANVEGVSYIKVTEAAAAGTPDTHTFDISGAANFEYFTSALKPETAYTATIYFSDDTEGNTIEFTTMPGLPSGAIVVSDVDELKAAITGAVEGDVIALNPGTYTFLTETNALNTQVITAGMTITSATKEMPVIVCKLFQFRNTAEIELFRMENIIWQPEEGDGPTNGSGTYLLDTQESASNASVRRVELSGLVIRNVENSLLRNRNTGSGIRNLYVDNCAMFNMAAKQQFIQYPTSSTYAIGTVSITNSTITNIGMLDANRRLFYGPRTADLNLVLTNNTITVVKTTSALIDVATPADTSVKGKVTIKNNVIYNIKNSDTEYVRAPNFGAATLDIDNNNLFKPFAATIQGGVVTVWDNWSTYGSNNGDPMFKDIDNNDLTLNNQSLAASGYGDPRWR